MGVCTSRPSEALPLGSGDALVGAYFHARHRWPSRDPVQNAAVVLVWLQRTLADALAADGALSPHAAHAEAGTMVETVVTRHAQALGVTHISATQVLVHSIVEVEHLILELRDRHDGGPSAA